MKIYTDIFNQIISLENLFLAWDTFKSDKRYKSDVQQFEWNLEREIFALHRELRRRAYRHGSYSGFYITDPKQRHIHKAKVRDRILHHAVFSILNPIFEPTFISTSFSCRIGFGTHRGVLAVQKAVRKVSKNGMRPCFVLKCDIRKFFDSVDHATLLSILKKRISDPDVIWLLSEIVNSYDSGLNSRERERERDEADRGRGIPIGNLTSQFFANVYMNEFDQFMKHGLKIKHYFRYTDDFVIVSDNRDYLVSLISHIRAFLSSRLRLKLHPKKVSIRKLSQGIDFLGYVVFLHHRTLRTKTKKRIFKNLRKRIQEYHSGVISRVTLERSLQSYLGALSHADTFKLKNLLLNSFWLNIEKS